MTNWHSACRGLSPEERFWQRVDKRDSDDCWEWMGCTVSGYGRLLVEGKATGAHRLSWEIHNDEIPEGMQVCHHCDNPACVNPSHLFIGTHADNMADKKNKGRALNWLGEQSGSNNHQSRLTEKQVLAIKAALDAGAVQTYLAKAFDVSQTVISDIHRGKLWGDTNGTITMTTGGSP